MSNQKNTPPKFDNDHDALVFLIEKYHFKGGWIGAGGMGPDGEIEIKASAPEWAKELGSAFVFDLHCEDHPVLGMGMEEVGCAFHREDSKLLLTRNWSSPIKYEGPRVLKPRSLQEAITSILGIKSIDTDGNIDDCALVWTRDDETGLFIPDTDDFVLYDSEFNDITCSSNQALEILDALRQPGMTEDDCWSSFTTIGSIQLTFARLDRDYYYSITGLTKPEDITDLCLRSKNHCRP